MFAEVFGFPNFYGRNMDAWIDCMSYLDDPESGMTTITCKKGEYIVLDLAHVKEFKKRCPKIYDDLIECSSFVNWRSIEAGEPPLVMVSFYE